MECALGFQGIDFGNSVKCFKFGLPIDDDDHGREDAIVSSDGTDWEFLRVYTFKEGM